MRMYNTILIIFFKKRLFVFWGKIMNNFFLLLGGCFFKKPYKAMTCQKYRGGGFLLLGGCFFDIGGVFFQKYWFKKCMFYFFQRYDLTFQGYNSIF